ncbi:putative LPS assembly protein LptD [Tannerella forsythia]|uniref:putative LPS assembly protein LptD n=1 Tax=Tannerella forsythia TaxID=28112 RepID=UPI00241EE657|nr:putative LPS assembly protein LptD [Tannerella forsythia]
MIGWIACVCALWTNARVQAQESVTAVGSLNDSIAVRQPDSLLKIAADSTLRADTATVDTTARKKSMLEAPVTYQASDSIVLTGTNMAYLYGESNVKYQNIELQAERIEMSMDSSIVYATFALDSVGAEYGYPLFVEGEQQIEAKSMRYNFRSRKAYANEVLTQQGEGFLTAGVTKKMPDDAMNLINGRYTTCDEHDHPHFYIKMTKAKVRPGKDIVTGPAYLVIEDVPLFPIGLPFGFFPFSSTYSSGIIMPTYGDEMARGFNLRNGGYYFAISDYIDLALTGEIYTKGSWGLAARSSYRKRYKYSGSVDASYLVTKTGDKGLPDYSVSKDFRIAWTHSQDMKANPYRTFSASVNFSTSSYSRNQLNMLYTPNATDNNKGSSVSISQRFPNNPINISATMNINQRSQDSSLSVTLPDMSISMSSIYPLKRKHIVGKERWYEKISISYSGYFRNTIHTKENEFLRKNLIKDWKHGMQHAIPISATYNFGFLNISPSVNYTERWLTDKVYHKYDTARNALMPVDTVYGFYRVYNYNAAISASTTLYGFFKPWAIFGDKVKMIRHRMEPSVSFSMSPDFGSRKYGYYEDYSYVNRQGETVTGVYSPFKDAMFGPPGRGKQGSINFAVENNVEMKIRSDADSTGERKISLIEKLGFNISYNLAADSFKWSDLNVGLNLRLSKSYSLILNGIFDVYTYGYDTKTQRAYPVNKTRWQAGKGFPRLRSTSTSFSYTFNNDTFKKWFGGRGSRKDEDSSSNNTENEDPDGKPDETGQTKGGRLRKAKKTNAGEYDEDGYYNATVPWNLSFHYNMGLGYGNFNPEKMEYNYRLTHNLSFSGSIQPTKNWRISMNGSFDVEHGKFHSFTCSISRDLHCFQMSANVIPIGPYKSYSFSIAVNSSLLKDLKYNQSNTNRDQQSWY